MTESIPDVLVDVGSIIGWLTGFFTLFQILKRAFKKKPRFNITNFALELSSVGARKNERDLLYSFQLENGRRWIPKPMIADAKIQFSIQALNTNHKIIANNNEPKSHILEPHDALTYKGSFRYDEDYDTIRIEVMNGEATKTKTYNIDDYLT
jgi:hypothetical protein